MDILFSQVLGNLFIRYLGIMICHPDSPVHYPRLRTILCGVVRLHREGRPSEPS